MSVQILVGDVFDRLAQLPDESVNCVVTSPPYWGLRDYGVTGQIGREPSLKEHLDVMVRLFREIWRVLRRDGTCWLNYGDCYATKAVSTNEEAKAQGAKWDRRTKSWYVLGDIPKTMEKWRPAPKPEASDSLSPAKGKDGRER